MLRMLSSLTVMFAANASHEPRCDDNTQRWLTDPLSHPVLNTMSQRELADVPFRLTARRTVHETASFHAGFGGRC
ncbi:propionyl-CoA synthetase [Mesorhizobium sp. B2-3-3]|nr:propionyl-CoA synthetase [Mesorhizobium sp. B2-3-3]